MYARFQKTGKGTSAYIQKSVRVDGHPKTITVKCLGLLEDIQKQYGCADPRKWVNDLADRMTKEQKKETGHEIFDFSSKKEIEKGQKPLRMAGDLLMQSTYTRLGLPKICSNIAKGSRIQYNLDEILRTLVFSRVISPCSKIKTFEFAKSLVYPPEFSENDMYRSLSLLSGHIDDIQASMYKASTKFMERRSRVIYYDCTNYYFEIEDNDKDRVDVETGEVIFGLRKRGKSKENRPNPIVQMGLFMDGDGIPLAFNIFSGNESEQLWLQPLEKTLDSKFDLTEFVVSTDCGLASEDNRRYNMTEGRDYICVQSLPSLKAEDQKMAIAPEGWKIAYCDDSDRIKLLPTDDPERMIFNLSKLLEAEAETPGLLKGITLYREIIVEKTFKYDNPVWMEMEKKDKGAKHLDADGKSVPRQLSDKRNERIIVTYSHDFALYLKHKRDERLRIAEAIVRKKDDKGRQSQQSPRKYVKTIYRSKDGSIATKVDMAIDEDTIVDEAKLDGFYAYGTSLDDDAIDILKARSFHHEIEHLFRTTKTFIEARPVYLSNPDRIRTHFLICFIAMTILKIMQKELTEANQPIYKDKPLSIDSLIDALQKFAFFNQYGYGYSPAYTRTELTDQLQQLIGINLNTQIIKSRDMKKAYRSVK